MATNQYKKNLSPTQKIAISQWLLQSTTNNLLPFGKLDEAASTWGVCRRTISTIWTATKESVLDGSPALFKSKKIGIPKPFKVPIDYEQFTSILFRKRTSIRRVARELHVSKSKVGRWVKEGVVKPHTNAVKPLLTEKNRIERLQFSLGYLKMNVGIQQIQFDIMHQVIHIDEKWFFMCRTSDRGYKAPDEEPEYRTCKSKRYIPKIMFMCAVSRPVYASNGTCIFDGKIGIFPFTKIVAAKRKSKNREAGTLVTKPIDSITKDVTRECLINQIIPAIMAKWPAGASKTIYIQQDNANPHISNNDEEFRAAASSDGFNIQLICQAPNSPDININDLGWFRAIQSLQIETASYTIDDLVKNVLLSYEELSHIPLNKVFLTLQSCLLEIMQGFGHNDDKIPHMGKDALIREDALPITLVADEMVVIASIDHLIELNQVDHISMALQQLVDALDY